MINANELRLNNWYSNGIGRYTLSTSDFMDFLNEAQVNDGVVRNIDPIPLSPEVLEACGFAKDEQANGDVIWFKASVQYIYPKSGHPHFMHYGYPISSQRCQFLHQLQNLYFSLTGEELNYPHKIK